MGSMTSLHFTGVLVILQVIISSLFIKIVRDKNNNHILNCQIKE